MAFGGPFCEQSRPHYGLGLYSVGGGLVMWINGLVGPASRGQSHSNTRKEGGRLVAADLKFLHNLQQTLSGTSNRKAALDP
jgi:hypothetical protein